MQIWTYTNSRIEANTFISTGSDIAAIILFFLFFFLFFFPSAREASY
jgi:hypothetical protein